MFIRVWNDVQQSNMGLGEALDCKNGANIEGNVVMLHWQLDKFSPVHHTQLNGYIRYTIDSLAPTPTYREQRCQVAIAHSQAPEDLMV